MLRYSKSNVETVSSAWMLLYGELSKLKKTAMIDDLGDRQVSCPMPLNLRPPTLKKTLERLQPQPDE